VAITLSPDTTRQLHASIKKFLSEHLDEDAGDLKATMFLDFCLQEIGPSVYNRAIADAQAYFTGRVQDLEGVCYEPEFSYWLPKKGAGGGRPSNRT
jgi:uncharacterized protein (DUF2164 family)